MRIFAKNAFIDGRFQPATITVSGETIKDVSLGIPPDQKELDLGFHDGYLIPGLIDLQLNGVAGVDFSSASQSEIELALTALPITGTTSVCPTVITSDQESIKHQVGIFSKLEHRPGAARNLGVHLEGPVISPTKNGAHPKQLILTGEEFFASGINLEQIKILTLAPEVPGAIELIAAASASGVIVSLGHTAADLGQAKTAIGAGASMVTHLFNAMPQIHHRDPGIVMAALLDSSVMLGLIVDGEHVAHELVDLVFRLAPDRAIVVSDASAALLAKPGQKVRLGGIELVVSDAGLAKREDGTLASSGMSQLEAIEDRVRAGMNREQLIRSATMIPADLIGQEKLGRIAVGAFADLVHYQPAAKPEVDLVLIAGEKCQV